MSLDPEDENVIRYGTPLEPYEEDEVPSKRKFQQPADQYAVDEHGRRRFHGSFTGGFSAGFGNTVGSQEGWTPTVYRSSRSEKAKFSGQKPEDFMDEEDRSEHGIAPRLMQTYNDFSAQKRFRPRGFQDGPIPGKPPNQPSRYNSGQLMDQNTGPYHGNQASVMRPGIPYYHPYRGKNPNKNYKGEFQNKQIMGDNTVDGKMNPYKNFSVPPDHNIKHHSVKENKPVSEKKTQDQNQDAIDIKSDEKEHSKKKTPERHDKNENLTKENTNNYHSANKSVSENKELTLINKFPNDEHNSSIKNKQTDDQTDNAQNKINNKKGSSIRESSVPKDDSNSEERENIVENYNNVVEDSNEIIHILDDNEPEYEETGAQAEVDIEMTNASSDNQVQLEPVDKNTWCKILSDMYSALSETNRKKAATKTQLVDNQQEKNPSPMTPSPKQKTPGNYKLNCLLKAGMPFDEAMKYCERELMEAISIEPIQESDETRHEPVLPIPSPQVAPLSITSPRQESCLSEDMLQPPTLPAEDFIQDLTLDEDETSLHVSIQNSTPMSMEQVTKLHRALILSIASITPLKKGPKFNNYIDEPGKLHIACKDVETLQWLEKEVLKLKPWPEAELFITKALSKSVIASIQIRKSVVHSISEAFVLLKVQNERLYTERWKIHCTKTSECTIFAVFSVDEESLETIRKMNGNAFLGLTTTRIYLLDSLIYPLS